MTTILSPGWTASPARTVPLALPAGSALRGVRAAAGPVPLVAKSAADTLDFALDVSALLTEVDDALAGVSVSVPMQNPATDIVVLWDTILSGQPVMLLGGGAPGSTTTLQVLLRTVAGRVRAELLQITVDMNTLATPPTPAPQLELPGGGTVPVPPNAIALPDGSILTDGAGFPYLFA